jgi:hypothetical protein
MALIMTVYNMKRAINILGIEPLLAKLQTWKPDCKKVAVLHHKPRILRRYKQINFILCPIAA